MCNLLGKQSWDDPAQELIEYALMLILVLLFSLIVIQDIGYASQQHFQGNETLTYVEQTLLG